MNLLGHIHMLWIEPTDLGDGGRSSPLDWTKVQPYNIGRAYGSAKSK